MSIADMVAALNYSEKRAERLRDISRRRDEYNNWCERVLRLRQRIERAIEEELG